MQAVATERRSDLEEYLGFLFGDVTGYVYAPTKDLTETDLRLRWQQHFFQWPQQKEELIAHILDSSETLDVYVAPAIFSVADSNKKYVKGSSVIWTELDGKVPDLTSINVPSPSMIVQSSDENHQHWYWRLEKFQTDVNFIENLNRTIAYAIDGADTSGWDVNQVLRPPSTFNRKVGAKPTQLRSISFGTVNATVFNTLPEPPAADISFTQNDLMDAPLIIARHEWSESEFNFFRLAATPVDRSIALMRLGYQFAEMGMEDREIFTLLYNADERWGKFKGREDRFRRLSDIISKARIKHPYASRIASQPKVLPIFGFNSFLDTNVELEWVIPNMLEKSGQLILSAKPGVGKSQVSLRFAISLALGVPFLHYPIQEPRKLIFFSLEMGHAQLLHFLRQMAQDLTLEQKVMLEQNLLLVPLGEALYIDRPLGQRLVEDALSRYEVDGYFFDSLSRTTPKTVNDEEQMKAILDWDASMRQATGAFSWFIHHNRKAVVGNSKPKSLDDLLGATVIQANSSAVYTLWPQDPQNQSIEFICVKQRLAEVEKPFLINRAPNLNFLEKAVIPDPTNLMESIADQGVEGARLASQFTSNPRTVSDKGPDLGL